MSDATGASGPLRRWSGPRQSAEDGGIGQAGYGDAQANSGLEPGARPIDTEAFSGEPAAQVAEPSPRTRQADATVASPLEPAWHTQTLPAPPPPTQPESQTGVSIGLLEVVVVSGDTAKGRDAAPPGSGRGSFLSRNYLRRL